jgi:hypothetical protein
LFFEWLPTKKKRGSINLLEFLEGKKYFTIGMSNMKKAYWPNNEQCNLIKISP